MSRVRVEPFSQILLPRHDTLARIDTPKFYIQTQFYHYYQFLYLNQQIILIKEEKYVSKKRRRGEISYYVEIFRELQLATNL